MKASWIVLALVIVLFLAGCAKQYDCEKPFIIVDGGCCTDANKNLACDKDETPIEAPSEPEVTGYTIKTKKDSYAIGEEVKFVGEFESDLYAQTWKPDINPPEIYKKEGSSWTRIYTYQIPYFTCEEYDAIQTEKGKECMNLFNEMEQTKMGSVTANAPAPMCIKIDTKNIWVWDQKAAKEEDRNCEQGSADYTLDQCYAGMKNTLPGEYKAKFSFFTADNCVDRIQLETNKFTIA